MRNFYIKNEKARQAQTMLAFCKRGRFVGQTDLARLGYSHGALDGLIKKGILVEMPKVLSDDILELITEEISVDGTVVAEEEITLEDFPCEEEDTTTDVLVCQDCGCPLVGRQKKFCKDCKELRT